MRVLSLTFFRKKICGKDFVTDSLFHINDVRKKLVVKLGKSVPLRPHFANLHHASVEYFFMKSYVVACGQVLRNEQYLLFLDVHFQPE